jgi:leucyl-tRNA synthetase
VGDPLASDEIYDPIVSEQHWRARWMEDPPRRVASGLSGGPGKFYNLVEFPYPSAEGLHVGHAYTYCGADVLGRFLRMSDRAVFQPMGFDSFGIHTENYALKIGEHPRQLTRRTVANFRRQLDRLGAAWNWEATVTTSDPEYYRWTQWIFVRLFEAGLADHRESTVIWCPSCLTVLAFEQVDVDRCERCGTVVTHKVMKQWYLQITAYADELLDALEELDWPETSKRLQREWIGRSDGTDITFTVAGDPSLCLQCFTTRPDTLGGVTFLAIAPENEVVDELLASSPDPGPALAFREEAIQLSATASRFSLVDRLSSRGVDTGVRAINPLTGKEMPIYLTDYVVSDYGTGIVMGVPAHDTRDFEFARVVGLPIVPVVYPVASVEPSQCGAFVDDGVLHNSGPFDGMTSSEARAAITTWLAEIGSGRPARRYRLRDWLVSRQRYWGSPIPIVHCPSCGPVAVPLDELPVLLPEVEDFRPTGTGLSPLASVPSFVETYCPRCGEPAHRETDVLDTFVESSWYFLRYPSYDCDDVPWDPARTAEMLPVDFYAGGREHSTRHHLYARFVTRALADLGALPFREPFTRLRLHGMITKDGAKMSKSRGNVVNPDEYIERVGADNLRAYLLFCGPWEQGGDFSDAALQGMGRFAARTFRFITGPFEPGPGGVDLRPLDRGIAAIESHIRELKFNTAISSAMELVTWAWSVRSDLSFAEWRRVAQTIVLVIAPIQPYLAEELWDRLGEPYSVHDQDWPSFDEDSLVLDAVTLAIQVNGKMRDRVEVPAGTSEAEIWALVEKRDTVMRHVPGGVIRRAVFVPDRVFNIVAPVDH